MTTSMGPRDPDTIIIGAGQAGLATAHLLQEAGIRCLVLDEDQRVGDQWRHRYDSLRLNTPAKYDSLPGLPFPAPPNSFPTAGEMGDYLESYAQAKGLDVRCGTRVLRVERRGPQEWVITTQGCGQLVARNVVVATGGERHPKQPAFAGELDPGIRQQHSSTYRNAGQLLPGPVLVVGASQSGADLALEIVNAGHETWLSGTIKAEIPIDIEGPLGRVAAPILWFVANRVLTDRTPVGRRVKPKIRGGGTPLARVRSADLDRAGVKRVPARTVGVRDGKPVLDDGQVLDVANVVWCTGFRQEYGFIHPAVTDESGWPVDDGGIVTGAPGLYFVGLLFQSGFYSMLVGGVGRDAARIARHIAARDIAARDIAARDSATGGVAPREPSVIDRL